MSVFSKHISKLQGEYGRPRTDILETFEFLPMFQPIASCPTCGVRYSVNEFKHGFSDDFEAHQRCNPPRKVSDFKFGLFGFLVHNCLLWFEGFSQAIRRRLRK